MNRFFEIVKGYGDVAEHDRVPAFVAHLDLLREAGDDPAVAEADPDDDAVAFFRKSEGCRTTDAG